MKLACVRVAILILVLSADSARAESHPDRFRVFVAAGSALGLGSARFGTGAWEFGVLNSTVLGAAKQNFVFENVYASLGFGMALSLKTGLAIYGGLGWEPRLFWNVNFRSEMNASTTTSGQTIGGLLAGLCVRF